MTTTLNIDSDPATQPQHPRRWRALTVSLAAAFMTLLDVSIVNVALPSIKRDLGASAASVQWIVSGYSLAFGLVLGRPAGWATSSAGAGCSWSPSRPSWPPAPSAGRRRPPSC
jgi:MFS family permease